MTTTATLESTTRTVGKVFFALMLLLVAVAVGFGGTALFVYHQFGDVHHPSQPAHGTTASSRPPVQPAPGAGEENSPLRQVANVPSDQPAYTYADNNAGQPTVPGKHARPISTVPAPLEGSSQASDPAQTPTQLNDPESHYIVDAHTGRVVGIDGSAGARREAQEESMQQQLAPPRAVAVQTPPPEVRVASPVLVDGQPIYHDGAVGAQYLPIRKALPVTSTETNTSSRAFNAGEYMMNDQDRPVLRAQAVVPAGARVVKTVRVYRLPDGSQTVAAE